MKNPVTPAGIEPATQIKGPTQNSWREQGDIAVSSTADVQMSVATVKRQSAGDQAPGICAPLR